MSNTENLWLRSLTNKLKGVEYARKLIDDYKNHAENNLYKSVLETIMHANPKTFREVNDMSDIFMEIVQEKFDQKLKEETEIIIKKTRLTERISLIQKKCAKNKPLSIIADELETESDELQSIYNIVSKYPQKTVDEIYELVVG